MYALDCNLQQCKHNRKLTLALTLVTAALHCYQLNKVVLDGTER